MQNITHHNELVGEIDAFLKRTGMGPSYFGKKAVGNSEVVDRLKTGRRVWPETEKKLRQFIAENTPSTAPLTGAQSATDSCLSEKRGDAAEPVQGGNAA